MKTAAEIAYEAATKADDKKWQEFCELALRRERALKYLAKCRESRPWWRKVMGR